MLKSVEQLTIELSCIEFAEIAGRNIIVEKSFAINEIELNSGSFHYYFVCGSAQKICNNEKPILIKYDLGADHVENDKPITKNLRKRKLVNYNNDSEEELPLQPTNVHNTTHCNDLKSEDNSNGLCQEQIDYYYQQFSFGESYSKQSADYCIKCNKVHPHTTLFEMGSGQNCHESDPNIFKHCVTCGVEHNWLKLDVCGSRENTDGSKSDSDRHTRLSLVDEMKSDELQHSRKKVLKYCMDCKKTHGDSYWYKRGEGRICQKVYRKQRYRQTNY